MIDWYYWRVKLYNIHTNRKVSGKGQDTMKIAIGSDHRGFKAKESIKEFLKTAGHSADDFGAFSEESADYPDFAFKVGKSVVSGENDFGILICGTGIGMSISVNKIPGVRGVVCRNIFEAQRSRQHNNANILCLGADTTDLSQTVLIIGSFLETRFVGGRHQRRLDKITEMERPF